MDIFWFLPTFGDGHFIGSNDLGRSPNFSYLLQIAHAAESLGYEGVLIPTGRSCEDSFATAAALAPLTTTLKLLCAIRPGTISPNVAARMVNTINRISGGRVLVNVVAGGDPAEAAADGIFLSHDERYALTDEFLTVWRQLQGGEKVSLDGAHVKVRDAELLLFPDTQPEPSLFLGGSSAAAHDVVAKHIDVYLTWSEPPKDVDQKLADVRQRAKAQGREVRFGLRSQIVVRETEAEAWAAADRLLSRVDDDLISEAQAALGKFESEGQTRLLRLHQGRRDRLVVSANLWAGFGLVRGGVGCAIVGSPQQVAERILEYQALGIDYFILSGLPHLEEAYRFAELAFPLLGRKTSHAAGSSSVMGVMGTPLRRARE
jgi:alkanesulfonate monooxygenase